ncbi:hypothetical protein CLV86_1757 [Lacinutrix venerupis]|uniref:hypothetical protein n=1 Tax=Lacinutrix venerupis TaxID=1486034 RepID=UPI000EAF85EC|nr:hypothetical protein [Lacinutrix venerupis]RLJ63221.1 hypothetical protein CLV86_1757 [Lacinutrix venerupis]
MSDKKQIDRLFQEKFKDFEAKPSNKVWENIQSKINHQPEKTKTVFPLWLRLSAIAAILLLLFSVGNFIFSNQNTKTNTTIVNTNSQKDNTLTNTKNSSVKNNDNSLQKNINKENKTITNPVAASSKDKIETNNSEINSSSNSLNPKNSLNRKNLGNKNLYNVAKSATSKNDFINQNKPLKSTNNNLTNKAITNNNSIVNSTLNETKTNQNATVLNGNTSNKTINSNKIDINSKDIIQDNVATNANVTSTKSETEKEEEKLMELDSANSSNAIEEAIAKIEDLDEKEEKINRWTVNANAAPVYYNTLGKGSHIHDQFIDNPKNGEVNTSYGINVGYALNDKLKVRSGINKLNLSYDTANIIVYENVTNTPSNVPLRNINFIPTSSGQNISVLSSNSFSVQQISEVVNDNLNAALSQRLSYLEVPLELEYSVIKKRFGLNLIGGFSTFFLSDNEVVTEVENRKTKIGEANNINNLSFSANAGIGIDYKFSKTVKFNLEPTFKYQINAYNETSGNFRPYIIGVYTGISYKF